MRFIGRLPVRYVFFSLAASSLIMAAIDQTMVAVAVPGFADSLNAPLNWVGWTLTAPVLVQIGVLPLAGRLSDEWGRKRVFLLAVATFTTGSLLCGLAPNIGFLIVFRAIEGVGAGGLIPSVVGIISDQFKERRGQAIGLFTSVFPIGAILGPSVGALILEQWSWRELFFVNVPVGILIIVAASRLLPVDGHREAKQHIDFVGLGLFFAGMATLMYAMTAAGNDATFWRHPFLWLLVTAAAVLGVLFVRHEARTTNPMVEVPMLAKNPFAASHVYNVLFGFASLGFASFVPYYAVVEYRMSTMESGQVFTFRGAAVIVASVFCSLVMLRSGYRVSMMLGAILIIGGQLILGLAPSHVLLGAAPIGDFWVMATAVTLLGIGIGFASPSSNNALLDLDPQRAASITGLRSMFRNMGGILGVSTTTLVLSYFDNKAEGIRLIAMGVGIVLLITIPMTLMIPDPARRRWLQHKQAAAPEDI